MLSKKKEIDRLLNPLHNYEELERHLSHARAEGVPFIPLIAPKVCLRKDKKGRRREERRGEERGEERREERRREEKRREEKRREEKRREEKRREEKRREEKRREDERKS